MSVFLPRITSLSCRSLLRRSSYVNNVTQTICLRKQHQLSRKTNYIFSAQNGTLSRFLTSQPMEDAIEMPNSIDSSKVVLKKKQLHKKANVEELSQKEGHFLTLAYATADAYDMKALREGLVEQKLYNPCTLKGEMGDVIVANAVYEVGDEPREIIFFKEGAVVFWNCTELEAANVLEFVSRYEIGSYPREVVEREKEIMSYVYQDVSKCHLNLAESQFVLSSGRECFLERHTFSHGMAQSARLGAWERRLEPLAASLTAQLRVMQAHGASDVDRKDIVRKLGELFSLRHQLNVDSDLLDLPDLYWEQEHLERIYSSTIAYFTIPRRTRVLNSRLSHCVELLELVSSWASDRHHVRLELMIIALILVEVCFELLHFAERLLTERQSAGSKGASFSSDREEAVFNEISIVDI